MTGPVVRSYRRLLGLLPPPVTREERDEMADLLDELLREARDGPERAAVAWRAFRRLPLLLAAEWYDVLRGRPEDGETPTGMTRRESMGTWIRRVRQGVRSLGRSPGFTLSAVVLVGLGVGAVTTVFTVVDHVLLRPLPYPAEERLVYLTNGSHSGPVLRALDDLETVEAWTAVFDRDGNLDRPEGDPVRLRVAEVTPSFFSLFGARPAVGRLLVEADGDAVDRVVLTHQGWTTVWNGDPAVVGSTIRVDGSPLEVVGVLSSDFALPETLTGKTLHLLRPMDWSDPALDEAGIHRHAVAARLAPGATLEVANRDVEEMVLRLEERHPGMLSDASGALDRIPFALLRDHTVAGAGTGLGLLLGAVGILLLVACANVAHLFLARGLGRQREVAVRRALGAGTAELVGQLSAESLVVGIAGALLGLGLTMGGLHVFGPWIAETLPRGGAVSMDWRILVFATALSMATAFLFGLFPALRTVRSDDGDHLRGGGRGLTEQRSIRLLRNGLVAGEVALSLVLVTTAGTLLRSFLEMQGQEPGVQVQGAWVIPVDFPTSPAVEEYVPSMEAIRQALVTVPGVTAVTYGLEAPFQWVGGGSCCWGSGLHLPGTGAAPERVRVHAVEASFLETYGIDLVAGVSWPADAAMDEVRPGVLAESVAVALFGSAGAALGREVAMGEPDRPTWIRVTGVAADTRYYGLDQGIDPAIYLPVEALPFPLDIGTFGVRTQRAEAGFGRALREAVWSVQPSLPLPTVVPLREWVDGSASGRRFGALLLVAFGGMALVLAAGGLYGTLLYGVQQRRRELGIRMALGATRERVQGEVLRRGITLALGGSVLGLVAALLAARLLESLVFGVGTHDPLSMGVAAALLLGTAALASWIPARKAARTEPLETLNGE